MHDKGMLIGYGIMLILFLGALSLGPLILMVLWNWVIPGIFHGATITYWQALGLTALLSVIGYFVGGRGK